MRLGATWMERVEAGCLSLPRNSAILVFSFPLGSSALGLPLGVVFSFPSSFSNLAFALSSLGFLLLLFLSFLKLSVHMLLGPSGTLVPSGSLEGGSTLCTLLWVVGLRCTGAGALVCRKAGPAGNLNPNG